MSNTFYLSQFSCKKMKIQKHLKVIRGKKREVIQFRRGAIVVTKSSNLTACEGVVPGSQMAHLDASVPSGGSNKTINGITTTEKLCI